MSINNHPQICFSPNDSENIKEMCLLALMLLGGENYCNGIQLCEETIWNTSWRHLKQGHLNIISILTHISLCQASLSKQIYILKMVAPHLDIQVQRYGRVGETIEVSKADKYMYFESPPFHIKHPCFHLIISPHNISSSPKSKYEQNLKVTSPLYAITQS